MCRFAASQGIWCNEDGIHETRTEASYEQISLSWRKSSGTWDDIPWQRPACKQVLRKHFYKTKCSLKDVLARVNLSNHTNSNNLQGLQCHVVLEGISWSPSEHWRTGPHPAYCRNGIALQTVEKDESVLTSC